MNTKLYRTYYRKRKWWVKPLAWSLLTLAVIFDHEVDFEAIRDWTIDNNGYKGKIIYE